MVGKCTETEGTHTRIAMRENISYENYGVSRNERERELWEGGTKKRAKRRKKDI